MSAPGGEGAVTPFVVDAFGARWAFDPRGLGPPLDARLAELWRRAAGVPGPGDDVRPYVLDRTATGVMVAGTPYRVSDGELPYTVSRALTNASIRRRTGTCLMLHAAGVAGPDGATLALVAASGTGKTTAARVLGRTFGYVSDETVAVEADGTVRAHPKPLSVVVDPAFPYAKDELSPDALGLQVAPPALHLGGVVLLDRDPAAGRPRLERVGVVEAALEVVPQTSALLRMADPLGALTAALTAGGGPWRLTYAEVADCPDLVAGLLADASGAAPAAVGLERGPGADDALEEPVGATAPAPSDDVAASTPVRRARWRHAARSEGSVLVVVGSVPVGLAGLAATVWDAAADRTTATDLTSAAEQALGPHPDADRVVLDTVRGLVANGVLERA